jgi:DNA mismatch repair protein MutS2
VPGIVHRSSDSGATIYVEPAPAVELNNRISNLRADEAEEIARLLWELAHEIHINADAILKTIDTLAIIDLTVAKLRWARDYDMQCPETVNDSKLYVRDARHPLLLDLMRKRREAGEPSAEVVPISYRLGDRVCPCPSGKAARSACSSTCSSTSAMSRAWPSRSARSAGT